MDTSILQKVLEILEKIDITTKQLDSHLRNSPRRARNHVNMTGGWVVPLYNESTDKSKVNTLPPSDIFPAEVHCTDLDLWDKSKMLVINNWYGSTLEFEDSDDERMMRLKLIRFICTLD